MATRRRKKKSEIVHRSMSKSKGKVKVTCYQCGKKGHKKLICRYYKVKLRYKKKTNSENEAHNNFKGKEKEKANVASNIIIEKPLDVETILCPTIATNHDEVNGLLFLFMHNICRLERAI